jgi:hypothetical protein
MVAKIDTKCPENHNSGDKQGNARPAEEPGKKGQCRDQMNDKKTDDIILLPLHSRRFYPHRDT